MSEDKNSPIEQLIGLFQATHTAMQNEAANAVNSALVIRNWLFGWYIAEFEKQNANRADIYGKNLMINLSEKLTESLGKGFSRRSLDQFRQFYEQYQHFGQTLFAESLKDLKHAVIQLLNNIGSKKTIGQTLFSQSSIVHATGGRTAMKVPLGWSHYLFLMSVSNVEERQFYEIEAANNGWSVRELKRQFDTSLYERLTHRRRTWRAPPFHLRTRCRHGSYGT